MRYFMMYACLGYSTMSNSGTDLVLLLLFLPSTYNLDRRLLQQYGAIMITQTDPRSGWSKTQPDPRSGWSKTQTDPRSGWSKTQTDPRSGWSKTQTDPRSDWSKNANWSTLWLIKERKLIHALVDQRTGTVRILALVVSYTIRRNILYTLEPTFNKFIWLTVNDTITNVITANVIIILIVNIYIDIWNNIGLVLT